MVKQTVNLLAQQLVQPNITHLIWTASRHETHTDDDEKASGVARVDVERRSEVGEVDERYVVAELYEDAGDGYDDEVHIAEHRQIDDVAERMTPRYVLAGLPWYGHRVEVGEAQRHQTSPERHIVVVGRLEGITAAAVWPISFPHIAAVPRRRCCQVTTRPWGMVTAGAVVPIMVAAEGWFRKSADTLREARCRLELVAGNHSRSGEQCVIYHAVMKYWRIRRDVIAFRNGCETITTHRLFARVGASLVLVPRFRETTVIGQGFVIPGRLFYVDVEAAPVIGN